MPRPTGLTRPQIGSGRASPGTVDPSALSNPDQGTDGLRVHIQDPNRAHMAATIGIVDAGGYYLSDQVEGALQEIGGTSSGGRQNGIVTGFGYVAAGLIVTFATPSTALLPTLRDYSGAAITLPNNTASIWVYISPATGLITQFVGANPPTITTPENVLLWQFTTGPVAITAARDARFYVRNLDRKLPFTVRSVGAQADQESEACFVTLDAAMTYLQYSANLGSLRTEVIVRGSVNTGPIDLPIDGIHFRGEDGGALVLTSGAYLIDTKGKDDITFADLGLQTDVAAATAVIDTVGTSSFLSFTRCNITSGSSPWDVGLFLANSTGRLTVSNCRVSASTLGLRVFAPAGLLIDQAEVVAVNFVAGSEGLRVGVSPTGASEVPSTVRGCTVTGFDTGIRVSGVGHVVTGCSVVPGSNGAHGIRIDTSQGIVVSSNRIDCSVNGGVKGIYGLGTAAAPITGLKLLDNTIYGAISWGIQLEGMVQETSICGNQVDGNTPLAPNDPSSLAGIYIAATNLGSPSYTVISENTVWRSHVGIYVHGFTGQPVTEVLVSNNVVHHCAVGITGSPGSRWETSTGIGAEKCSGLNVTGNNVYGIGSILTDAGTVVLPTAGPDVYAVGILLENCDQIPVTSNKVSTLAISGVGKALGIQVSATGLDAVSILGSIVADNTIYGIPGGGVFFGIGNPTAPQVTNLTGALITGNSVTDTATGISVLSLGRSSVDDVRIVSNMVSGTTGGGNGIVVLAATAPGAVPDGVMTGVEVTGNTVGKPTGTGIYVECMAGASATGVRVTNNVIIEPGVDGVSFIGGDLVGFLSPVAFRDLAATGNRIVMDPITINTSGINLDCVVSAFSGATLSDNTIANGYRGVRVVFVGPGPSDTTVSSLSVCRNVLTNVQNIGVGVNVQGLLSRSECDGNQVVNTVGSTQCMTFVLTSVVASASSSADISISDNVLRPVPGVAAISAAFSGMKVNNLSIERNDVRGGAVGALVSLTNSAVGAAPSVNGLTVRGNQFNDVEQQGVSLTTAAPADELVNIDISGNTFNRVAKDAGSVSSASVLLEFQSIVRNLSVRGNQFYSCGRLAGTDGGITVYLSDVEGIAVADNQFNGGTVSALTYAYGNSVVIRGNPAGGFTVQNLTVSGNTIRNTSLALTATLRAHIALDLANFVTAFNVSVDGNDVARDLGFLGTDCLGIAVQGTQADCYDLRVDGNRVSGVDLGTPITQTGLSVLLRTIVQGSVSGNYIRGSATVGVQGVGIAVNTTNSVRGLSVCNNKVLGESGNVGNYGLAVSVPSFSTLNGSQIDGNLVNGYPTNISVMYGASVNLSVSDNDLASHDDYGIVVDCTGAVSMVANLTVDGNRVTSNTDAQSAGIFVTTSDSGEFENLSVCGNQLRYSGATIAAADGIFIRAGSGGTEKIGNANVCRNSVMSISTAIRVNSGETLGVRIDNNGARDVLAGITHRLSGSVIVYSVSGNSIQARTDSTANGLIYVYHNVVNQPFQEVSIDGNDVGGNGTSAGGGTHGGDAAIRVGELLSEANARSVSVSGNNVRSSKIGITAIFATSQSVSFDNNKVTRTYYDGINVLSSAGASAGDTLNLSISGNSVTTWCEVGASNHRAIGFTAGTTGSNDARGIAVSNNNCVAGSDTALGFYIDLIIDNATAFVFANNTVVFIAGTLSTKALDLYTGGAVGSVYRNFVFTGNVFRNSANGIDYTVGVGGAPSQCTFMGNIGDNGTVSRTWWQFENGGGAGWTAVLPPPGAGAGQFRTFNIDDGS